MKHTKGNWELKTQGDANEYCIITDENKWVTAFRMNGEQTVHEQMANAKIMTAAPKLLEALKELHEKLSENPPMWYMKDGYLKNALILDKVKH